MARLTHSNSGCVLIKSSAPVQLTGFPNVRSGFETMKRNLRWPKNPGGLED
jgi:hypothetical protein